MTLVEFILARLADDEAAARAAWQEAVGADATTWRAYRVDYEGISVVTFPADENDAYEYGDGVTEFITRFGPGRVLAECAAKRAVIALHPVTAWIQGPNHSEVDICHKCGPSDGWPLIRDPAAVTETNTYGFVELPLPTSGRLECETLLLLAQPYAAHADFDVSWVVSGD